jgi:hypothetical protein
MRTAVLLYRNSELAPTPWVLARYKGDMIAPKEFRSAKAARAFAKGCGWGVRRAADCDT